MSHKRLTNNHGNNPVNLQNSSVFSNFPFCQVNRRFRLCNFFLCSNEHVEACFPFLHQRWGLKTTVIAVVETSSNVAAEHWDEFELLQLLSTTEMVWSFSGSVINVGTLNSCVAAVERAAPPSSAFQSRMQRFHPSAATAITNSVLWAQTWHAIITALIVIN